MNQAKKKIFQKRKPIKNYEHSYFMSGIETVRKMRILKYKREREPK